MSNKKNLFGICTATIIAAGSLLSAPNAIAIDSYDNVFSGIQCKTANPALGGTAWADPIGLVNGSTTETVGVVCPAWKPTVSQASGATLVIYVYHENAVITECALWRIDQNPWAVEEVTSAFSAGGAASIGSQLVIVGVPGPTDFDDIYSVNCNLPPRATITGMRLL